MGGMNAAGRTSGFHSYKRMLCDVLPPEQLEKTWLDLAHRMGLPVDEASFSETVNTIKLNTLVRRIEHFDPENVVCHHKAVLEAPAKIIVKKSKLAESILAQCAVEALGSHDVQLTSKDTLDILMPNVMGLAVTSAGSLPRGFDPSKLYNSHHHPRGLAMTIYGISDALNSLGIEWDEILKHIHPDEVSVYAGSALSQVDENSMAGVVGEPLKGNRINSKMMAMSLAEMPADFVNSYVLNSIGTTGHNVGACATFLYNLKQGAQDIQSGRAKVAIVGCSEAPIVPEIIEGFRVMGALATDEELCELDGTDIVDNRRACRPFSTNAGFTLAESVQFFVLMEDELALKLGVTLYGAVADVFINADANKKSIASPGVGNYVTVAKAAALARAMLGDEGLKQTFVQAHGTGTPQNRTTESHILNEVAKTFSISAWPVAAVKSYLGHSVAVAGGDQLAASLGVWQYGWIPGIKTIDHVAADVYQSNLNILMDHQYVGEQGENMKAVILNSKGFGGNNASALVLSPLETKKILVERYGKEALMSYQLKNEQINQVVKHIDEETCQGHERIIYNFGASVMDGSSITITPTSITLTQFGQAIALPVTNPYKVS